MEEILNAIPHRPPFLFVDKIVELSGTKIKTTKEIRSDEPVFRTDKKAFVDPIVY